MTLRPLPGVGLIAAVAIAMAGVPVVPAQRPPARPRLIVLLVADQFRADFVDQYSRQWTGGLHRMVTQGAVFTRAAYPYAITKTCAGHSSIGTGTLPSTHGMIDNDWWDASKHRTQGCTEDRTVIDIPYGGRQAREHHSAALLMAPTLGDELQRQIPSARVVSVALKPRSAIGLGGHGGPHATIVWEEDNGTWATSTAYAQAPSADVDEFVTANPQSAVRGQIWDRLLPAGAYRYQDDAPGELAPRVFPHLMTGLTAGAYLDRWERSPYADAFVADLGKLLTTRQALGQQEGRTDMLAMSFAAPDYVGHHWGPRSHEVQDILIRLDRELGRLFDQLDATIGRDKYVVAFSSDHGVAILPEQGEEVMGVAGGRINKLDVAKVVDLALAGRFGQQSYVEAVTSTYIYFRPGVLERIEENEGTKRAVELAVRNIPGIERTYWSSDLSASGPSSDRVLAGLRKSYFATRSGQLAYLPRPNWIVSSDEASHGTMHAYDTDVPLILLGAGIKPGRYGSPRTPLDIAPTLAELAGISMPSAQGVVLTEALRR
jgi:predicted AlkP superfamily pyrophosphatase or phosphodiesterase